METQTAIHEKARDLKDKELEEYTLKVNKLLDGMKSGDILQIEKITKPETRELFIETVKKYMREHEWQAALSFAKSFLELRKYDLDFIKNGNKKM
jgi:hypothetical protein